MGDRGVRVPEGKREGEKWASRFRLLFLDERAKEFKETEVDPISACS